ncbi:Hpt domain-containing protein [Phenylobacterium sp. LjRoot225]|uniref:Hpt domain-containing protein n=1 Tax=Phenylobacterium sp. LjRoot225 TaxID=3342285 RepID=UPI003ED15A81
MSSTTPAPTDAYAARLAELRQRFRARLPAQLTVIHKYAKQLHRGELAPAELKPLRIELHSLAGSAGAFGEAQLGAKAKALENWLIELERGALSDAAPLARELLAFTSVIDGDGEPPA